MAVDLLQVPGADLLGYPAGTSYVITVCTTTDQCRAYVRGELPPGPPFMVTGATSFGTPAPCTGDGVTRGP